MASVTFKGSAQRPDGGWNHMEITLDTDASDSDIEEAAVLWTAMRDHFLDHLLDGAVTAPVATPQPQYNRSNGSNGSGGGGGFSSAPRQGQDLKDAEMPFPFGKHKGVPLKDVEPSYWEWISNIGDAHEDWTAAAKYWIAFHAADDDLWNDEEEAEPAKPEPVSSRRVRRTAP